MPKFLRNAIAALAALTMAFAFSGCSASSGPRDERIHVLSATPVWASVAAAIGGDLIVAESIITKASQDPHSYEATARDQLKANQADLFIVNGWGYDDFFGKLAEGALADLSPMDASQRVINVAGDAHGDPNENEHYWFELDRVKLIASSIAWWLENHDATNAASYEANYQSFENDIASLQAEIAAQTTTKPVIRVLATEPIGTYLLAAFQVHDVTPKAFSKAIEDETDAPLSALHTMLKLLRAAEVSALVVNPQTASVQVTQLVEAAKAGGVPVVELAEFSSDPNQGYINWMSENIRAVATALQGTGQAALND